MLGQVRGGSRRRSSRGHLARVGEQRPRRESLQMEGRREGTCFCVIKDAGAVQDMRNQRCGGNSGHAKKISRVA